MDFLDRGDAGRRLAAHLLELRGQDAVVYGLPRGGVVVGYEVSRALAVPLDVIVVRKLGVPHQPELAMGAIGEDGALVVNPGVLRAEGLTEETLWEIQAREQIELDRRVALLRAGGQAISPAGRIAVIVDDGIATGATAVAACRVVRARGARTVVLAVPVAAPRCRSGLASVADSVVCLVEPRRFRGVGASYVDFGQAADEVVVELLARRRAELDPQA
jgi:putative phosphoribosyl transferase